MTDHKHATPKPGYIVRHTSNGPVLTKAPKIDPKACPKCGKRHGFLQFAC